jgi:hypothetical protein
MNLNDDLVQTCPVVDEEEHPNLEDVEDTKNELSDVEAAGIPECLFSKGEFNDEEAELNWTD